MTTRRYKYQRRIDSSSSEHCCVPLCGASSRFNSAVSFHTFPVSTEIREKWIKNIRREKLNITYHTRVCCRHFTTDDLIQPRNPIGRRLLRKGAVPTLFKWNGYSDAEAKKAADLEHSVTIKEIYSQGDIHHLEHDYCSVPETTTADNGPDPVKELREEVERLRRQVEEMSVSQRFCLGRFAASDDDIKFYTRFTTCSHLMAFWKLIEPASNNMIRVSRVRAATMKHEDGMTDGALDRSLQPIDEFFLFMVHLSVGLTLRDLGHRFNIHESTVSQIITTWANFLYTVLGSLRIWMSAEAVKAHLPNQFQDYPDTRVLIHCTELRCQTPLFKSEDFSYKSHRSFKGLIGMAPHGAVTFVSSLFAASVSDTELFKQSGIMSLLKPEMAIMFDNSLLVDECVPCKVYRPAYLLEEQISADEEKIQLRVHIEGLVHRVKQHKLLDTVIPLSVTGSINQIYTVACLLVNYQNGPLVEGWAED
nr:uncharacterized protein LOC566646 isoform X2 [Danio rerio]|eukprot:XP_005163657.1 uncharacterized protein LOC566646 isoform X2 [Danio rerio]